MYEQKQHRNDKLQKCSVLFLQLGLVLALFFVYTALEFQSSKKQFPLTDISTQEPTSVFDSDIVIKIKRKVKNPAKKKPQTKSTSIFTKIRDEVLTPTTILDAVDPDEPLINDQINALPEDNTPFDVDEIQPFILIEDAPIFPGCEGLEKEASKACFSKEVSKFINKNFNTGIAESLNLSGKQKIWVQFKIDKTGLVTDIEARATHKKLEKEAIRIVEKLPQMTPGKQRKKPVNVKYVLPIIFQVY